MQEILNIIEWAKKKGLNHIYTRDPMPDDDSMLGVPEGQHPFDCSLKGWADRWCLEYQNVFVSFRRGYSNIQRVNKYGTQKTKTVITGSKSNDMPINKHPLYTTWTGMIQRCHRVTCQSYPKYGARGITVCERWRKSFDSFVEDMGPKPEGHTIDRIDNTKGYSPENCRWADWITQANNRTNNIPETKFDEARRLYKKGGLSIRAIGREVGMPYGSVWKAIHEKKSDMKTSCEPDPPFAEFMK